MSLQFIASLTARFLGPAILLVLLASCGGGGDGGGGTSLSPPSISNFSHSPTAAYVSVTPVTFTGEFSFSDPDGNLSTATLAINDAGGTTVSSTSTSIEGVAGLTSGQITGSVDFSLPIAGDYTLRIFVTDSTGLDSNTLSGAVRIASLQWTSKAPMPTPRQYFAVAILGGQIYVMGGELTDTGQTPGPATSTVEIYDPGTNLWNVAPALPTARMGLMAAVVNGKLYAIGGRSDGSSVSAVGTVDEFDPASQIWSTKTPMPTVRYFGAGVVVDGRILVIGGERETNVLNLVESYNPLTDAWSTHAALPTARGQLSAAEINGRAYAVGGYAGLLSQWVGTVEEYSPLTNAWSTRSTMVTQRSHLALATVNGKLLAVGGENFARALDAVESFDPATDSWSAKTLLPAPITRAAGTTVNGKVYVIGNGVTYEYDPANELL